MTKLPFLLSALLLSASPAVADDFVYLRCKESADIVITNSTTSKIIDFIEKVDYSLEIGLLSFTRDDIGDKVIEAMKESGLTFKVFKTELGYSRF